MTQITAQQDVSTGQSKQPFRSGGGLWLLWLFTDVRCSTIAILLRSPAEAPWLVSDFDSGGGVGAQERTRSLPEGPCGVSAGSFSSGARIGPDVGLLCAAQPRRRCERNRLAG